MTVRELINNQEFTFNPKFKLVEYDFDKDLEIVLCSDEDDCSEYYDWEITAINQEEDGTVTIECTLLCTGYEKGG